MTFPWEQLPATQASTAVQTTEDTVRLIQRDLGYMVQYTAILVHSKHDELKMLVNTPRGQIIPRGECKFTDGSTLELQDIGMPQVGAPVMTVAELMARVWDIAKDLNLSLE